MLPCAIGIVLYNRPKYTKMLFEALERNHYCGSFPVYVSIDYSDAIAEILTIVYNAKNRGTLKVKEIWVNRPKFGCGRNHIETINKIPEEDFIFFEDDTIPQAPDTLNYFYSHFPKLKAENLFSICGYSKVGGNPFAIEVCNYFCPWGFAMTKAKWMETKRDIFDCGRDWKCSWDTAIQQNVHDKNTILPLLSRIQNVGAEQGTHVPNSNWHHDNHHVTFGAWDTNVEKKELGKWHDSGII